jgi:hypothetical protein
MERGGLSRSVAMQLTGHKTEPVYRRYAITSEADLREGVDYTFGRNQRGCREICAIFHASPLRRKENIAVFVATGSTTPRSPTARICSLQEIIAVSPVMAGSAQSRSTV